jgi:hypothetical protein
MKFEFATGRIILFCFSVPWPNLVRNFTVDACVVNAVKICLKKTRDVDQVKCIKDGAEQLLVTDEEIKHRWREYFDKLFNGETKSSTIELDNSFDDTNRRFV